MAGSSRDFSSTRADVRPGEADAFVERRSGARRQVPTLTVLWYPDLERVGERLRLSGLLEGREVPVSRLGPGFRQPGEALQLPLADRGVPRQPLLFSPSETRGSVIVTAARNRDRIRVDGVPLGSGRSLTLDEIEKGVVIDLDGRVILLLHTLSPTDSWSGPTLGLIGASEAIGRLRREIQRVGDLDVPVLLKGETGTGKELVAEAVHSLSPRKGRPWVSVNLGAVPPTLAAAELFGASKGAFTGAVTDRAGFFRRAHTGTLFLDEVGEAPAEVQVMLLRVLETGELQPLGSPAPVAVDVRVIAATDADLERAIDDGEFRAPLLHRLASYEIQVPPLRERMDDFGRLLLFFLRRELAAVGEEYRLNGNRESPWLPSSIVARLARYSWPGNVRQLQNVVRQLVIGSRGSDVAEVSARIDNLLRVASDQPHSGEFLLPNAKRSAGNDTGPTGSIVSTGSTEKRPVYRSPGAVGEDELLRVLAANRWALKPTAEALGVSRTSLYSLVERSSKVRKASDLNESEIRDAWGRSDGKLEQLAETLKVSVAALRQRIRRLGLDL